MNHKNTLLLAWACLFTPPLFAKSLPDPDPEWQRQRQRAEAFMQQAAPASDVFTMPQTQTSHKRLADEEFPCFYIHDVVIAGLLPEWHDLPAALAGPDGDDAPQGRCLGGNGIELLMERVQNALIDRGAITSRVDVAPQDLTSGRLVLNVTPGRIGRVALSDDSNSALRLFNAAPMRGGALLNLRDIEQALENLRRVPSADATIDIIPGDDEGVSDLVVGYQQARPYRLQLSLDDSGTRTTGKYLGNATLFLDNSLNLSDTFYLSLQRDVAGRDPGSRGNRGYIAHYSLPFGYWQLGLTRYQNRYHQTVAGATLDYRYSGESTGNEIQLGRVLHRSSRSKTSATLKGFQRSAANFIDDTEVEVQRRRVAGWELGASHRHYLGRNQLDAHLAYRRGTGALGALPAPEQAFGEGTSRMQLVTGSLALDMPFQLAELDWYYNTRFRWQWNQTPLTPQDRLCIGGRYSVRGFDGEQNLCGDRGLVWSNELGTSFPGTGLGPYVGIDAGRVAGPSAEWLPGSSLAGAVIGLRASRGPFGADLFAGGPLSKPTGFDTARLHLGFNLSAYF